jgi:mRNA interferase RelE/StbE
MAIFNILYHPDIPKDIARIPLNIRQIIARAIDERLGSDPVQFGEPLRRGLHGYRKLRVGDYRIIYEINKHDVQVLLIGNRKDVYDKAPRRVSKRS